MQAYYSHFLTFVYTFFEQFSEHLRPKLDNALYGRGRLWTSDRYGMIRGMKSFDWTGIDLGRKKGRTNRQIDENKIAQGTSPASAGRTKWKHDRDHLFYCSSLDDLGCRSLRYVASISL